jgi:2-oxoglutarate ferredoxin oxidoreductase subunit alpha
MVLADGILGQMMEPIAFDFDPIDPASLPALDWNLRGTDGGERRVIKSYDLRPGKMEEWNFHLERKYDQIRANETRYESFHLDDAEIILTGYGTAARICESAMMMGRSDGLKIGLIRPITLWPFPVQIFRDMADKVRKFLVVEMSLGQYVEDVQLSVNGKSEIHLHKRPAGGIPTGEEVLEITRKILGKDESWRFA